LLDVAVRTNIRNITENVEEIEMQPRIQYAKIAPGAMTASWPWKLMFSAAGWSVL
jgi:hypothetical protein